MIAKCVLCGDSLDQLISAFSRNAFSRGLPFWERYISPGFTTFPPSSGRKRHFPASARSAQYCGLVLVQKCTSTLLSLWSGVYILGCCKQGGGPDEEINSKPRPAPRSLSPLVGRLLLLCVTENQQLAHRNINSCCVPQHFSNGAHSTLSLSLLGAGRDSSLIYKPCACCFVIRENKLKCRRRRERCASCARYKCCYAKVSEFLISPDFISLGSGI